MYQVLWKKKKILNELIVKVSIKTLFLELLEVYTIVGLKFNKKKRRLLLLRTRRLLENY